MILAGRLLARQSEVENFVIDYGDTLPASPVAGQLFFKTDEGKLYCFDGTEWKKAAFSFLDLDDVNVSYAGNSMELLSIAETEDSIVPRWCRYGIYLDEKVLSSSAGPETINVGFSFEKYVLDIRGLIECTATASIEIQFNSDTTAGNYTTIITTADGSSITTSTATANDRITLCQTPTAANTQIDATYGISHLENRFRLVDGYATLFESGTPSLVRQTIAGVWTPVNAISSITILFTNCTFTGVIRFIGLVTQ